MLFATLTDFYTPPMVIPNIAGRVPALTTFLDGAEVEGLKELLGLQFYDELVVGIAALPSAWAIATAYITGNTVVYGNRIYTALVNSTGVIPSSDVTTWEASTNKWLSLKVGDNFLVYGKTQRWAGMSTVSVPLIVAKYLKYFNGSVTSAGAAKKQVENAIEIDMSHKYVIVYNKYVEAVNNMRLHFYATTNFDSFAQSLGYTDFDNYIGEQGKGVRKINSFGI